MKIEYYDDEFPYIIINDLFGEKELELVWEELNFLCYKHKSAINPHDHNSLNIRDSGLVERWECFLNYIYTCPERFSNIPKAYSDTFVNHGKDIISIIKEHGHWMFQETIYYDISTLLNYYEGGDFYSPHVDMGHTTMLHWLYKEPKSFNGGELVFPKYKKMIPLESNKSIIFPSCVPHAVIPVEMEEEDLDKKMGRWCITNFISTYKKSTEVKRKVSENNNRTTEEERLKNSDWAKKHLNNNELVSNEIKKVVWMP